MNNTNIQVGSFYRIPNLSSCGGFEIFKCISNLEGALHQDSVVEFTLVSSKPNGIIRISRSILWVMPELEKL